MSEHDPINDLPRHRTLYADESTYQKFIKLHKQHVGADHQIETLRTLIDEALEMRE